MTDKKLRKASLQQLFVKYKYIFFPLCRITTIMPVSEMNVLHMIIRIIHAFKLHAYVCQQVVHALGPQKLTLDTSTATVLFLKPTQAQARRKRDNRTKFFCSTYDIH